jgi:hypothetical protein
MPVDLDTAKTVLASVMQKGAVRRAVLLQGVQPSDIPDYGAEVIDLRTASSEVVDQGIREHFEKDKPLILCAPANQRVDLHSWIINRLVVVQVA